MRHNPRSSGGVEFEKKKILNIDDGMYVRYG